MKADFNITYTSGRTEMLSAKGAKAIKEMRRDLESAKSLGGVVAFKEATYQNEEQRKSERRRQAATFLKPETLHKIQQQAIVNGTSVSAEIAKHIEV